VFDEETYQRTGEFKFNFKNAKNNQLIREIYAKTEKEAVEIFTRIFS
jgi:hypothetical protein